ncbi:GNAT family N-acetyltransferase [Nocardioides sp. YIM 152315]|uniref:GNAT family N-acetyltransferase n=1 Tax=Nocardioides sp. YIM 152315 TaxID=3031760 RepID=UPI0023DA9EB6|nr:GNAT family N-acetyltransferase [Nocardioides sp. YIM 152315]MDF1602767.1 GNAT family N-acetyltransferase [Nocardioides sp. YIM 152315]
MLTTRHGVRPLGAADLDAFLALARREPVVNVFADYRATTTNLEPRWLGGEMWGRFVGGELAAACHVGANLVPICATLDDAAAFAERALARGRTVSTIVGPQEPVQAFWNGVASTWGPPREARWEQPHLEISTAPVVPIDPYVRRTTKSDMDELYPACVAMYTEEVGVSPEWGGGAELYRARVAQLVSRGWSYARFDDSGRLVFKAEVACATPYAAQVQGVFVPPEFRGRGVATAGMASVVQLVRREIAPVVSLYVNEWNTSARAVYEKVGFRETARFATIMF